MNNRSCTRIRFSRLAYFVAAQLALPMGMIAETQARDVFNPALLELDTPGQTPADLSAFEENGGQMPGTYRVDVYLNNVKMDTRNVEFRKGKNSAGQESLIPCLPVDDLASWGVLVKKFPQLGAAGSQCADLSVVPQAKSDLYFSRQQLLLSFPQSAVSNSARGWVDPKLWDEGISAILLNYSASGASNYAKDGQSKNSNSQYVNLRPGINIGPWRLRNYTTWNSSSSGGNNGQAQNKWSTVYTYIQRNIIALKSQLIAGDSNSPSDVFDSIPFRGGQLASDDDMLPDSLKGYAPVVRGIAHTNAQVTIRQNGYVIYQTYVSPGSFEINDMYPTGGSGDLYINIKESDGSEQNLVVPYASLPVLQREGRLKYSVTSGVYRSYDNSVEKTPLTQGTAIYGLPLGHTIYGGGQFSSKYQSLALGLGKNLGDLGAVSFDVTQAWSKQKNQEKESGQTWRIRYSKNLVETGTNIAIAGYRYATDGYWGMQEVLDTYSNNSRDTLQERRRNRSELTLTQDMWQAGGNVALTAITEDYWNTNKRMQSYGASYNNSWAGISYGLSYTYSRNSGGSYTGGTSSGKIYSTDRLFSLNVSIPLDQLFSRNSTHPMYANYGLNTSKNGNTTNSVSLSGSTLAQNNLNWSIQEGYGSQGEGNSGNLNTDWKATYGEVSGGYGYNKYNQRLNYGVQGGIIAYGNGIIFGQPLGETVALVEAPGAKGVAVLGKSGVNTDFRGYAVVPYASPYRKNDITLDTQTLNDDTEVMMTTQTVIPTRGAVVKASYQANVGYRVLMTLIRTDGQVVRFGATVTEPARKYSQGAIVGDGGQVYLTGLAQSGQLQVQWGSAQDERCLVNYSIPQNANGIVNINGQCLQRTRS